jgi:hypothetical protein
MSLNSFGVAFLRFEGGKRFLYRAQYYTFWLCGLSSSAVPHLFSFVCAAYWVIKFKCSNRQSVSEQTWLRSDKTLFMDSEFCVLFMCHEIFFNHLKIEKQILHLRPIQKEAVGWSLLSLN